MGWVWKRFSAPGWGCDSFHDTAHFFHLLRPVIHWRSRLLTLSLGWNEMKKQRHFCILCVFKQVYPDLHPKYLAYLEMLSSQVVLKIQGVCVMSEKTFIFFRSFPQPAVFCFCLIVRHIVIFCISNAETKDPVLIIPKQARWDGRGLSSLR